ncbi:Vacuolar iron transporter-like protein 2 [Dichanthelium oligosanthes]|uniref:Vacuolar iron transporter-like protein 2 n=1 Tax=Dichanthelium oligosanthes TaxID=888268 RepID=A0A1E5ULL5_9POAL|nr:Vacuolar iron transporter-like protein 2 [Dichanthelium oligosanthes]
MNAAAAADPNDDADGVVDYMARAQWLRAAVLGANDGLVSVASLMIGVGAVNVARKAMLVSGIAGLVAGACSMAIGEFVSVYAQYDIEVSQLKRGGADGEGARDGLPSPTQAALASAFAFAVGALLPLLSGVFVSSWWIRLVAVCAASSVGLAGFGAAGAYLGGSSMWKSGLRVLLGGWFAMLVTFGVLRLFGAVFHIHRHSEGNVATMNEVVLSRWLSEEEWDVEEATTIEYYGSYFMEGLTEDETPSIDVVAEGFKEEEEQQEEWDAEGGFSIEVGDPDTSSSFIVFGYDNDEDWEALSNEEEDTKDEKTEPSLHKEGEEPQEYGADANRALAIHELPPWIHSMDPYLSSHVHDAAAAAAAAAAGGPLGGKAAEGNVVPPLPVLLDVEAGAPMNADMAAAADPSDDVDGTVDYMARAQWLRAAVLGANDGLVSVASLMIGVGAVNVTRKAMLVSGMAGLVAGACSMAIGEFVSVYAQYDIEVSQLKRDGADGEGARDGLPSPTQAALASALAFAFGALLPLLSGVFVPSWWGRLVAVCAASSIGLAGFGAAGAYLGGSSMWKSGLRVLLGGWFAMVVTFGVLRLFGAVFHIQVSSA